MIPLNICFAQNMKEKIIENYTESQDEKIEQLYKENAELKNILSKSLECMNENNNLTTGRCYSCKNGTGECESGGCVQCENREWKYKIQAEQALKGGNENDTL